MFAQSKSVTPTPTPSQTPPPIIDDEVLKIDTEVVNVLFTAQDRNRRLLTNLTQNDIKLLEDGVPQELSTFTRQVDLPLSLSILIDVSVSQQRTLTRRTLRSRSSNRSSGRQRNEVAVLSFTGETTLEQDMTSNLTRLRRAVENVKSYRLPAISAAASLLGDLCPALRRFQVETREFRVRPLRGCDLGNFAEVLGQAPERTRRHYPADRRTEHLRPKTPDDAVDAAVRSEAIIYSIGIGDRYYGGVDKGTLNKVSERTGGRAFFPSDENELRQAFDQIQEEMRSQYLIAYEPSNQNRDGSFRKIEIEIVNPQLKNDKVKLTHRQGPFGKQAAFSSVTSRRCRFVSGRMTYSPAGATLTFGTKGRAVGPNRFFIESISCITSRTYSRRSCRTDSPHERRACTPSL